ncbi:hypothetical protein [Nocardia sp. NPDC050412]
MVAVDMGMTTIRYNQVSDGCCGGNIGQRQKAAQRQSAQWRQNDIEQQK